VGAVADQIVGYAKKNRIDMILMGSHGRGALKSVLMGSVATRVLAAATMPVLIIR
jgi:nucleotide-binding universal stress UspA family protein